MTLTPLMTMLTISSMSVKVGTALVAPGTFSPLPENDLLLTCYDRCMMGR